MWMWMRMRMWSGVRASVRFIPRPPVFHFLRLQLRFVLPIDVVSPWHHFPPSLLPFLLPAFVRSCGSSPPLLISAGTSRTGREGKGSGRDGWRAASIRPSPLIPRSFVPRSFISGFLAPLLDRSTFDVRCSCIMSVCHPLCLLPCLPAIHPFIRRFIHSYYFRCD